MKEFHERMRQFCDEHAITQTDLAECSGLQLNTVCGVWHGRRQGRASTVAAIVRALYRLAPSATADDLLWVSVGIAEADG